MGYVVFLNFYGKALTMSPGEIHCVVPKSNMNSVCKWVIGCVFFGRLVLYVTGTVFGV